MPAIFRYPAPHSTMVSWFRRKKPEATANDDAKPRYSVEELAAAFPDADKTDAPAAEHSDADSGATISESSPSPSAASSIAPAHTTTSAEASDFSVTTTASSTVRSDATTQSTAAPTASSSPFVSPNAQTNQTDAASQAAIPAGAPSPTIPALASLQTPIDSAAQTPNAIDAIGSPTDHAATNTPPVSATPAGKSWRERLFGGGAATTTPAETSPAASETAQSAPTPTAEVAAADIAPTATAAAETAPSKSWRDRLRGTGFARSLSGLFSRNPRLDDDLLDEIETALLTADVGVTATTQVVEDLRKRMKARQFADANQLLAALRTDLIALLRPVEVPLQIDTAIKPFVILTVGVNGVGKTTTIGKLARRYKDEGRNLMLAAGDTFRAAAVAQLQAWGERNGVAVVAQGQNADAASVAYDALQAAQARGVQVLIADTAGRLHTQQGLMAELGKIRRVLRKLDGTAPHEVLMVVDGTTGQNAISQVRQFNAAVNVTGLVVTKLDGTAKGGVVFALAREFGIPIRYAGIGERPEDLRVFDAEAFVDALLPDALGA